MTSLWKPVLLSALAAMLVVAPTAEAHTLKVSRAAKANRTFAKLVCAAANEDQEGSCLGSNSGRCKRLSPHRVRCAFFATLALEDGSVNRCLSLTDWTIRGRSPRLYPHYLGVRSCVELIPASEEPAP